MISCNVLLSGSIAYDTKPMLKGSDRDIDFSSRTKLSSTTKTLFTAVSTTDEYHHHPFLYEFNSQVFAMYSSGPVEEGDIGQRVRFNRSLDNGVTWTSSSYLVPAPGSGMRYTASGFWERGGVLYALAGWDEGGGPPWGASLEMRMFEWDDVGKTWSSEYTVAADGVYFNYPPRFINGDYYVGVANQSRNTEVNRGDIGRWTRYQIPIPESTPRVVEPSYEVLADGSVVMQLRSLSDERLWRTISQDRGITFPTPVYTNFPDGRSKHYMKKLSNGKYILISNPNWYPDLPTNRNPLTISVSDDGLEFPIARMYVLRDEATTMNFPGHSGDAEGYQYPHAIEVGSNLLVIYSENKEDVKVDIVATADLV